MRRTAILMALTAAMIFTATGFATDDLMKDFVSFDRAFIPPLAFTNQEKVKPSKKGMGILKENWTTFKARHYEANPKDPQWKKDLDGIEERILRAGRIVASEKSLMEAHEILEEIRYVFMNLRKRNGMDYYIDHLSEFHGHMEAIMHTASERDAGSFTTKDGEYIDRECGQAVKIWERIQTLPFDKLLFGFDDQKVAAMRDLMEKETQALQRLKKALEGEDKARIIESAKKIRPNYAQLYKMFGDFDRVTGGRP
jgi:hypothetical protein